MATKLWKVAEAAVAIVRRIVSHETAAASLFLAKPDLFLSPSSNLTTAQRCGIFNLAMGLAGVGLRMPTDETGAKLWDRAVYERGVELAKGRKLGRKLRCDYSYAPVRVPGQTPLRSFYAFLSGMALTGMLEGVDPAKMFDLTVGEDGKPAHDSVKLKAWLQKVVDKLSDNGDPKTGRAAGVLHRSGRRYAVRADLPAKGSQTRGGARPLTADTLASELNGTTDAPAPAPDAEVAEQEDTFELPE